MNRHPAGLPLAPGRPRVVATVTGLPEARRALRRGAEILELRVDLMGRPASALDLAPRMKEATGLPLLVTNRSRGQGGKWRGTEEGRLALLDALVSHADGVDLEMEARSESILHFAYWRGATLILSHHDFHRTPPLAQLRQRIARMHRLGIQLRQGVNGGPGAPIVAKIATLVHGEEDLHHLFEAARTARGPVAAIPLGPRGLPGRVLAGLFGSVLTYGYVTRPAGPGQPEVGQLKEWVDGLYGAPR
ncbi:MAG: type I 3-dehydroquinate dehydratase [Euryarchaeota archaeon]|nr:type I 3-dehydroquinate dehydratase [Euryarchaeota archaeon]